MHIAGHLAPLQGEKWDGVDVSRRSLGEGGSRPSQMDEAWRESVKPRV